MTCVIVGEAEVYICAIEYAPCWVIAGYRIYGVAECAGEVEAMYWDAMREVSA